MTEVFDFARFAFISGACDDAIAPASAKRRKTPSSGAIIESNCSFCSGVRRLRRVLTGTALGALALEAFSPYWAAKSLGARFLVARGLLLVFGSDVLAIINLDIFPRYYYFTECDDTKILMQIPSQSKSISNGLVVYARAPQPGRAKKRLAAQWGQKRAADLYWAMLADTLALASRAASTLPATATVALADSNDTSQKILREMWAGDIHFQCEGDLGERLLHSFITMTGLGFDRACIIGSDCPDLPTEYLESAFDGLQRNDLVLGPTGDGGFYLIGTSRPLPPDFFCNVTWSSESTLRDVLQSATRHGLSTQSLAPWHDVDYLDDVRTLETRLRSAPATSAPSSRRYLESQML